jgi:hypothetical protein
LLWWNYGKFCANILPCAVYTRIQAAIDMSKAHAFISYVRDNGDIVDRLATDLRRSGVKVWLDRNEIMPGQRWRTAIRKAIQQGAFFIACYSQELNARPETYMHGELRLAIDRLRQMPNDRIWFVPVFLNKTEIPSHDISEHETLSDLHAVALHEDWSGGLNAILRAMGLENPISARVHQLVNILEGQFHAERLHALQELGSIGPAAADAVPALVEALKDQNQDVRGWAVHGLSRIGPAAMPGLVEALKNQDAGVSGTAARALGRIGPAAADAVPALVEALKNQNAEVRGEAAGARSAGQQHRQRKGELQLSSASLVDAPARQGPTLAKPTRQASRAGQRRILAAIDTLAGSTQMTPVIMPERLVTTDLSQQVSEMLHPENKRRPQCEFGC